MSKTRFGLLAMIIGLALGGPAGAAAQKKTAAAPAPVAAATPELAANGEERASLAGVWQFSTSPDKGGPGNPPQKYEDTMRVPGNWDATAKYSHYKGKAWYRRLFAAPAAWSGSRVILRFDAVYETAAVWVNGTCLGRHTCGYLPFEFDISAVLRPAGAANEVIVMADSTYGRGAWWSWGGISRDVWLVRAGEVRLTRQHVRAEPDLASGEAQLFIETKLETAGGRDRHVTLEQALKLPGAAGFVPLKKFGESKLEGKEENGFRISVRLKREAVKLWDLDHPNLYTIKTTLRAAGQPDAVRIDRFGIRKVETREGRLWLNGEPIRVSGFNRVSDDRVHGNTEPDALVRRDIDMMKGMGAGMARLMHFPQAPGLLDYLDEKGMMIFEEIPVWGSWDPNCFKDNPQTKEWLREEVERDYNHPCIIGWSVGNELEHHNDYVKSMLGFVRGLDPHRLASYISFTVHRKEYTPENDPATHGDMILWNSYGGTPAQTAAVGAKWPGKTQFLSEFGAGMIGPGLDAKLPEGVFKSIETLRREFKQVVGVSLWTFNDYRSDYPGTYPNEERGWGVVNAWRQEKRAAAQVREQFSPVAGLEVREETAGQMTVRLTPRGADDMPSFVLRDYLVKWEVWGTQEGKGSVLAGGLLPLPTLKPGDPAWSAGVALKDAAPAAREVVASVISPTGYVVRQARRALAAPEAPAIKEVLAGQGTVRVLFERVRGAESYRALYGKGGLTEKTAETIEDFVELKGLDAAADYQFAVVAVNGKGESKPSKTISARPQGLALPPVILAAAAREGGLTIGYAVEKGDTTFTLEMGSAPGTYTQRVEKTTDRGALAVDGLENGKTVYLRMKRQGAWGESGWSQEVAATPQAAAAPQTPRLNGVVRGAGRASLSFDPVEGATGYIVRCQAAGGAERKQEIHAAWVDQATIGGLEEGKAYRFAIAAVSGAGSSEFSAPVER